MAGRRRAKGATGETPRCALALCVLGLLLASAAGADGQEGAAGGVASPQRLLDNLRAKTYSGRPIDIDLPNASLREVVAELEKAGGFRLDMDPALDRKVTYKMRNIPWDEALAAVLADNGLRIDLDLAGKGFKLFRGDRVVLAFNESARAKTVLFMYANLHWIAAGAVLLTAVAVGLVLYRRRRARPGSTPRRPLLPADAVEPARKKLLYLLEVEKIYRDEGLTLRALAEKLEVSPHQLSWIVNDVLHLSFSALVNGYRVEEVKSRLSDPSFDHTSILRAALDAGFNTKASFNRAFKTHTGMTPSEFKKAAAP